METTMYLKNVFRLAKSLYNSGIVVCDHPLCLPIGLIHYASKK